MRFHFIGNDSKMMECIRNITLYLVLSILLIGLSGCTSENKEYTIYSVKENTELGCVELQNDGVTYRPYGIFNTSRFKGKQIGVREDDPDCKIHEVKGYDATEWIVEYLDVIMGGNMLYKAVDVTEIPEELEQYNEYDY